MIKNKNRLLLITIVIIAIILRFYHFCQLPYTHDELSALFRTYFDQFSDLIKFGVVVDGHPAGIQTFLYYWTKWFGVNEWIVKLPFTIAGVASLFLIYKIGKLWFNETVALIATAFVASLQCPIMYSQIARPYASGLFFTALMLYFWSYLILFPDKRKIFNHCGYILATTAACYNHYFSLLLAAIVGVIGLFIIPRKKILYYLLSGVVVALLFLPHLFITLQHLNLKGIGDWLAQPSPTFIFSYFSYLFHHSYYLFALLLILFIFAIINNKKEKLHWKKCFIFLLIFSLPIIIGYLYSVSISSVLHYGVLLFSFPYLFFILFGYVKEQPFFINVIIIVSILSVNIFTLIYEREHYTLFYNSIYEKIVEDYPENESEKTLFLVYGDNKMIDYYLQKNQKKLNYIAIDTFTSQNHFLHFLQKNVQKYPQLYLGNTSAIPPYIISSINHYYSKIKTQNNYLLGETYLFLQEKNKKPDISELISLPFHAPFSHWTLIDTNYLIRLDSVSNGNYLSILPHHEWSCKYSFNLSSHHFLPNDFIDIRVDYIPQDENSYLKVVSALYSKATLLHWSSTDLNNSPYENNNSKQILSTFHSVKLSDIAHKKESLQVEIYLWNNEQTSCLIQDIEIRRRKGNPYLYAIFEKIAKE